MARYFENGVCKACGMREIWWKKLDLCKECYSSESKTSAINAYEKWSAEDDLFLKEKILAGVSSNDIADTLKRKRSAITSRVKHFTDPESKMYDVEFTLKYGKTDFSSGNTTSATNAFEKWSAEDDLFLKEKILEGVYQKEIAVRLKRTPSAISKRVKHFTDPESKMYDVEFTLKYRKRDFSLIYNIRTGENEKIIYFQAKLENNCSRCGKPIKIGDLICKPENSKGFFVHEWHLFENIFEEPARTQKPSPKSNDSSQSDRIRNCPKCKKPVYLNSKNTQFRANQWEHIQCPTEKQRTRSKSTLTDEESTRLFFGDPIEFAFDSKLEKEMNKTKQDYYEKKRDERASRDN